jgi:hypothetical protein
VEEETGRGGVGASSSSSSSSSSEDTVLSIPLRGVSYTTDEDGDGGTVEAAASGEEGKTKRAVVDPKGVAQRVEGGGLVLLVFLEMIDRRTCRSVGTVGHAVVPCICRNLKDAVRLRRGGDAERGWIPPLPTTTTNSGGGGAVHSRRGVDYLPMSALALEVRWGSKRSKPDLPLTQLDSLADEEKTLRSDRVRLLTLDKAFASLRPCDMNLDYENAQRIFSQAASATSASSSLIDELGFHLFNADRGAIVQLHRVHAPISLQDLLSSSSSPTAGGPIIPTPSLGSAMILRAVLLIKGRVVGFSSADAVNWTAKLIDATLSDESFTIDREGYEGSSSSSSESSSSTATKTEERTTEDVMCVVRLFALLPNYDALSSSAAVGRPNHINHYPPEEDAILSRYGAQDFDACNPRHYRVVPYGWTVVDVARGHLLQRSDHRHYPLYRGAPSDEVQYRLDRYEAERQKAATSSSSSASVVVPTLEAVLATLERNGALSRLSSSTTIELSLCDVCHAALYRRVTASTTAAPPQRSNPVHATLRSTFLVRVPPSSIGIVEEVMDTVFQSAVFEGGA